MYWAFATSREDRRLVAEVGEVCAGEPGGLPRDDAEVDVAREWLAAGVDAEDRLAPRYVRRGHEDLAVEPARAEERGVEILEPVRGGHDDHLVARPEAVQLDEQLVQRLVVLPVEAAAHARGSDGVELVDEDDRRRVLPRLFEQLANSCCAEAGEHLHERRRALGVEVRAGRARNRLGDQRLSGTGRAVQEDPAGYARTEALEALAVAQELDHLVELLLRLVEPCDVVPRDLDLRPLDHRGRLRARHEPHRVDEEDDHDAEEDDRQPGEERGLEVHLHAYRQPEPPPQAGPRALRAARLGDRGGRR